MCQNAAQEGVLLVDNTCDMLDNPGNICSFFQMRHSQSLACGKPALRQSCKLGLELTPTSTLASH
jgi:hypothetical protein